MKRRGSAGVAVLLVTLEHPALGIVDQSDGARALVGDRRPGQIARAVMRIAGRPHRVAAVAAILVVIDMAQHRTALPPGEAIDRQRIGSVAIDVVLVVFGDHPRHRAAHIAAAAGDPAPQPRGADGR